MTTTKLIKTLAPLCLPSSPIAFSKMSTLAAPSVFAPNSLRSASTSLVGGATS